MKAFNLVIVILLIITVIFYFTKPTDQICIEKAKSSINGGQFSNNIPGYDNPATENAKGPVGQEAIFVKDKFLWKEVDFIVRGQIQVVGYGWLGSFHLAKDGKNKEL
jgi:hypothetical protein